MDRRIKSSLFDAPSLVPGEKGMFRNYTVWELLVPFLAVVSLILACILISPKKYFWNDELYSYYFISDPSFASMLAAFHDKINNTPILYFLLGWVWDKGFGSSELSLRLFSSFAMGLALAITWLTVRRTFAFWATAVGVLGVFCTSEIILVQNAEARMYGLFLALSALGLYFYDRMQGLPQPSRLLLFLNFQVHTGIVHTHLFGGFYSGAILLAFLLSDRYFKRFRPGVYLSVILSWVTILLYLPSFFIQADAGKPRTWLPSPTATDLLDLLNLRSPAFFQLGVALVLLLVAALSLYPQNRKDNTNNTEPTLKTRSEVPLLIFAAVFILVPVFTWLLSRTVKPIFYDRYMIPSALGWVIFIAYTTSRFLPDLGQIRFARGRASMARLGSMVVVILLVVSLFFYPIYQAGTFPQQTRPYAFATDGYDDLPIVVPFSHIFLQTQQYAPHPEKYFFIMDWEAAADEKSGLFSPQEYKHLDALRRNYPEHFHDNILSSEEFLARHNRFLVADYPDYIRACPTAPKGMAAARAWVDLHCPQWVEMRLLHNSRYRITYLNNTYWYTMLLVERQQ